ncbi:MAG: VWA domain-containing protein [Bacteroidetes bacterium]|nr:VWA domain-containing protein [Bacteroidota bacterium]
MSLTFHTPLFVVLLLVLASFAVSLFIYRHTVPVVSAAMRTLLVMLRGTAVALILLAVCEPLFRIAFTEEERPVIALLADNSLSMAQKDGSGDKGRTLTGLLRSDAVRTLAASADLRQFSFSHSLAPLGPDSLPLTGGSTNISGALRSVTRTTEGLRGIILLTDGNDNAGSNPLYDAEKSRIPLFTIGIGDTSEQKDLLLSKLVTNAIGYVDAAAPVEVTLRSSGIAGRSVTITLSEDGQKLDEQRITLPAADGPAETRAAFVYAPKKEGTRKLTASVTAVEGELTVKNNTRSVMVKVLKNRMNIAVIAGTVTPDVAAVMQTMEADANIDAHLFYQLPGGAFRPQTPGEELQPALAAADALILIGFPTAQTTPAALDIVRQAVESRSLSLLFIAGRLIDPAKLRTLEPFLPVTVAAERMDEQMVLPSIPERYRRHQLLGNQKETWDKLPPLFYSLPTYAAKPEAQPVIGVRIQNVNLSQPLFVVRNIGSARSAALLGYGLNRWKVLAGSADETKGFFVDWFSSLVRWLAVREEDKFLRVEFSKAFYAQGEQIGMTAQVYNESYQPADDAVVQVAVRPLSGADRYETALTGRGAGVYEGTFDGLTEGEYQYTAAALRGSDTLGTVRGRISVGEQSVEFAETKMDKALLQQMASASGGLYADASSFDALMEQLRSRPELQVRERAQQKEYELWTQPWFLAVVILLLSAEWLLRKRSGML